MIQLRSDCLVFETPGGEAIPMTAEELAVKLLGDGSGLLHPEIVQHAAQAVLYYFKNELGRETITVGEFSQALEEALRAFGLTCSAKTAKKACPDKSRITDSDLRRLACASGHGCELIFFKLLREELQHRLKESPRVIRFSGLRGCVKQLLGARRWTPNCQELSDQIVDFLRHSFHAEPQPGNCALLVV